MKLVKTLLLFFLTFSFIACDGSGSGSDEESIDSTTDEIASSQYCPQDMTYKNNRVNENFQKLKDLSAYYNLCRGYVESFSNKSLQSLKDDEEFHRATQELYDATMDLYNFSELFRDELEVFAGEFIAIGKCKVSETESSITYNDAEEIGHEFRDIAIGLTQPMSSLLDQSLELVEMASEIDLILVLEDEK